MNKKGAARAKTQSNQKTFMLLPVQRAPISDMHRLILLEVKERRWLCIEWPHSQNLSSSPDTL